MNKLLIHKIILFCGFFIATLAQEIPTNAFSVELYKSTGTVDSLSDADALIGGTNLDTIYSGNFDIVDFRDVAYGTPWGHSGIDNFYPGTTGTPNIDDYAVLVTTKIEITSASDWTFLTNADDGVRLRINGSDVIVDDSLHPTQDRLGEISLSAGTHDLEIVLFERGGVSALELWAAPGSHTAYNASDFRLVGDVVNGGIAADVPFDFSPGLGIFSSFILIGLKQLIKNKKFW